MHTSIYRHFISSKLIIQITAPFVIEWLTSNSKLKFTKCFECCTGGCMHDCPLSHPDFSFFKFCYQLVFFSFSMRCLVLFKLFPWGDWIGFLVCHVPTLQPDDQIWQTSPCKSLLEHFVILFYMTELTDNIEATKNIFTQKARTLENIPPTIVAAERHHWVFVVVFDWLLCCDSCSGLTLPLFHCIEVYIDVAYNSFSLVYFYFISS